MADDALDFLLQTTKGKLAEKVNQAKTKVIPLIKNLMDIKNPIDRLTIENSNVLLLLESIALLSMDEPSVYDRLKTGCQKEMRKFGAQEYTRQVADVYRKLVNN